MTKDENKNAGVATDSAPAAGSKWEDGAPFKTTNRDECKEVNLKYGCSIPFTTVLEKRMVDFIKNNIHCDHCDKGGITPIIWKTRSVGYSGSFFEPSFCSGTCAEAYYSNDYG